MEVESSLFKDRLLDGSQYYLRFPGGFSDDKRNRFLEDLKSEKKCNLFYYSLFDGIQIPLESYEFFWNTPQIDQNPLGFNYNLNEKRYLFFSATGKDFLSLITIVSRVYIYRFKAERLNIHSGGSQSHLNLDPNAQNLASALHYLSTSNPNRFKKLIKFISSIFANVCDITIVPQLQNSSLFEIKVWPVPIESERYDLAIPLSECGTGIGQVLALLFLVVTSETPRVIIIDEPNSFLHPGAVKKLIEIIKLYPQHQYIISTHSPEVIKASEPKNVLFLTQKNGKTNIERIDLGSFENQRRCLQEVGANLSDVFSADSIIWVEGITEEECFPLILKKKGLSKLGVSILAVRNTGDFQSGNKKEKTRIHAIYRKLSQANALIPPAVGFIFDKEGSSDAHIEEAQRDMGKDVKFLSRRMYENYLLEVDAITDVLNKSPSFSENPISVSQISDWIDKNGKNENYKAQKFDVFSEEWLKNVHASYLLYDLFQSLSGAREEFNKTTHSIMLTKIILENNPDAFKDIEDLLESFLK